MQAATALREVIERCRAELQGLEAIFLDRESRRGGDQPRLGASCAGDLIHISENDQVFLDGWSQQLRCAGFTVFAGLGQLSSSEQVPTDDEAWVVKPAHLRFSKGKIVYEAEGNVGTSHN